MTRASNLYTDLRSSLVKLGGLLGPILLVLRQALFIVCSNCWPLNKSIIRLVQLKSQNLVLDLVFILLSSSSPEWSYSRIHL